MDEQEQVEYNKKAEEHIIKDIEKYGFHIICIEDDGYLPGFAYTIGLYHTYQHPEVIIFGLKTEVMSIVLNHIVSEIIDGIKFLTDIDYQGYLQSYPTRFIKVEEAHYPDYFGYANWFYNYTFDYPIYQIVWTDKESRYPWEADFLKEWKFRQPILDRNTDFKFYEERNKGVFTTQATLDGKPVLSVYHNSDGDWQFHSEEFPDVENAKIVCLEYLVEQDQSLNEIFYLNYGQYAERKDEHSEWEIYDEEEKDEE